MLTLALENGFHTHSKAPRRTLTLGLEGLNICYDCHECCAVNEVAFIKSSSVGLMNLSVLVKVIGLKNPPVSPEAVNINFTQANMKTVQMIQELQLHVLCISSCISFTRTSQRILCGSKQNHHSRLMTDVVR